MITSIITALLSSKLAQALGGAVALLLAWMANGAWRERKGRLAHAKDVALWSAQQSDKQHKDREDVESDIRPANAADELRRDWKW